MMDTRFAAAKHQPARIRGFTLIELLLVMAVIGILAGLAYPSYTESVRKTRRTDAMSALMAAAQGLERCHSQLGNLYDHPDCPLQSGVAIASPQGFYRITPTVTAATYRLTATPVPEGPQATDAGCASFTLTNMGVRTATGDLGDDCWD